MDRLFYCATDEKLFYIPNNYTNGSGDADFLIKNIQACIAVIRKFLPDAKVSTNEITKSSKYKYMWYFAADCKPENCPAEAYKLSNGWTMFRWLQN